MKDGALIINIPSREHSEQFVKLLNDKNLLPIPNVFPAQSPTPFDNTTPRPRGIKSE